MAIAGSVLHFCLPHILRQGDHPHADGCTLAALTGLSLAGLWAAIPSYIQKRGAQTRPLLHEPAHLAKYSANRLSRAE